MGLDVSRKRRMARLQPPSGSRHRHSKSGCLKIFKRLSEYLDDELSSDVCEEVRAHMGVCRRCEVFFDSLRRTVSLCRHLDERPLTPSQKSQLRRAIHKALAQSEN